MPEQPNSSARQPTPSPTPGMATDRNPGDDAPAGTVGTGEDMCPRCGGSGKVEANQACPDCGGTGIIIQGIGGG